VFANRDAVPELFYSSLDAKLREDFLAFINTPPLTILIAHSRQGRLELVENESQQATREGSLIVQRYLFHYEDGGRQRSLPVRLFFRREYNWRLRKARWQLEAITDADDPYL